MPKIRVPERHRAGLKLIASLDQATIDAIVAAQEEHPRLDPSDLADDLQAVGLSREDRRKLLEALLPLYIVKEDELDSRGYGEQRWRGDGRTLGMRRLSPASKSALRSTYAPYST